MKRLVALVAVAMCSATLFGCDGDGGGYAADESQNAIYQNGTEAGGASTPAPSYGY